MGLESDSQDVGGLSKPSGVREVAAAARVSLGTVSNVLNRPDQVSPKTRKRVEHAMTSLGFVPSRAAGQLRSRRSRLTGVVVPDVGNPFWASLLRGVESVLEPSKMTMLVSSTRQDPQRQLRILKSLQSQGVDGLIIAPIADHERPLRPFRDRRYGVVTLGIRNYHDDLKAVNLDSNRGAFLAMDHLLQSGHRRIGMINGPDFVSWCEERLAGAVCALESRGLEVDDVLIQIRVADLTVAEGEAATDQLLNSHDVSAIMCVNDMLALGALLQLRRRGVRIPGQMSLIGYDDADFAAALDPPLTTIYQPSYEMGVAAAELLFRRPGDDVSYVQFEPELISRGSVGPPA